MRIWLALRVFIAALFDKVVAEKFRQALREEAGRDTSVATVPAAAPAPRVEAPAAPPKPAPRPAARPRAAERSEALTLLAALQREARLIDIVKEPLADYSDAQIGAAARQVLRDCGAVLDRMFGLQPVSEAAEGSEIEVPRGYDPLRYRVTGNVSGEPPLRARLVHPGWQATRCEVPEWKGNEASSRIVAPLEVEVA